MTDIAEPVGPVRVLAKPKRYPPLKGFCCGRNGNRWEKTVNDWARGLYRGVETVGQTVLVMEDANRQLVGLASFRPEPVPIGAGKFVDRVLGPAQCIHMVATDRLFHGKRLNDGSRPGDALLLGVLEQIKLANGGRMPYVWALVSPDNGPSKALFCRHGFGELRYGGEGEVVQVRPPHKRVPVALRLPRLGRPRGVPRPPADTASHPVGNTS